MAGKKKQKTVFLVHHKEKQRQQIAGWLHQAKYAVEQYLTGREFLIDRELRKTGGPLLLSMALLDMAGTEVAKQLEHDPDFPILLLPNPAEVPAAVESGFNFIVYPCKQTDLIDELESIQSGASFDPGDLEDSFRRLSERELEILKEVCRGLASGEIGRDLNISGKTVEAHRARIMDKTRARDVGELVAMWRQWKG